LKFCFNIEPLLIMMQSILFILVTGLAFFFAFKSVKQIIKNIKLGKDEDLSDQPNIRLKTMLKVAFGQSKMTTSPVAAFFHFIIYVGFILINIEVLEIIIDGITNNHRIFEPLLGGFYGFLIGFSKF
jgi:ABC-type sugar transport system permease subunit